VPKDDAKFFCVRDLPDETRKKIKLYAADHGWTMGQAVEALVNAGLRETTVPENRLAEIALGFGGLAITYQIPVEELVEFISLRMQDERLAEKVRSLRFGQAARGEHKVPDQEKRETA
jgi:plasmid stability protein